MEVKYQKYEGVYPEVAGLHGNFSICLSGGGMRAATCACGWIKGLEILGLKPKYISSVSGGSWYNIPYSYRIDKNLDFNGTYYNPKDCSLKNITSYLTDAKSFEYILSKANISASYVYYRNWSISVTQTFIDPYKLYDVGSYPTLDVYPIICSSLIGSGSTEIKDIETKENETIENETIETESSFNKFSPVEFTPNYHYVLNGKYTIDPISFTSNSAIIDGKIPKPTKIISLGEQAAFSSQVIEAALGDIEVNNPSNFVSGTWNVVNGLYGYLGRASQRLSDTFYPRLDPLQNQVFNSKYSDGACTDNTGILALVRRKETKIICLYSASTDISSSNFTDINMCGDFSALFGRCTGSDINIFQNTPVAEYNRQRQIFNSNLYDKIVANLTTNSSYTLRTTTIENPNIFTTAYDISVLFILCSSPKKWLDLIPEETKKKLPNEFPNISVTKSKYSPELVGALKQFSTYQITSNEVLIRNL